MTKLARTMMLLAAMAVGPFSAASGAAQSSGDSAVATRTANHPKILVIYDMEGVSGVTYPNQVLFQHPDDYAVGRKSLTADVNAAIRGLASGGAASIWVQDGHGSGNSNEPDVLVEQMDSHASFDFRPYAFDPYSTGIDGSVDAIVCIAMHARANTPGFMAHTYTVDVDYRVNDVEFTETHIVALSAARWGIPVIMVSGDDILEDQLKSDFPELQYAVVKNAKGHSLAEALPAGEAQKRIETAAHQAMVKFLAGKFRSYYLKPPFDFKLSFPEYQEAEGAAENPLVQPDGDLSIRFQTKSFIEGYEIATRSIHLAVQNYVSAALTRLLAQDPAGRKSLQMLQDMVIQRWLDWDHAPEWSKPGTRPPAKKRFYGDS
jgi:D-amino peptidase